MQLAIAQNPHTQEPKTLWSELDKMSNPDHGIRDEKMDKEGLMSLKKMLQNSSRGIAIK